MKFQKILKWSIVVGIGLLPTILCSQPITNLKQWRVEDGGNGHWYGILASTHPWVVHRDTAHSFQIDSFPGNLASITSVQENQFIRDSIVAGVTTNNVANEFYLGGFSDSVSFRWLSGDSFQYQNWNQGEPNGDGGTFPGRAVAMWGSYPGLLGSWNDCPKDTAGVGDIHQLWSVIEWGTPGDTVIDTNPPPPTLANVKQWRVEDGGNDHWYGIVATTMPWVGHVQAAISLLRDSQPGYLATSLSQPENNFIRDSIITGVVTNNIANEFYLGGTYENGSFHWLSGESIAYQNWNSGEPSGDGGVFPGRAIAIWGGSGFPLGLWNDCPRDTVGVGPIHQLWSVIEWGAYDTIIDTTPPPSAFLNVKQWRKEDGGNDHWYGIRATTKPWVLHQSEVGSLVVDSLTNGYLATITQESENTFIRNQIVGTTTTDNISNQFYLGLAFDAGAWQWTTGEPFAYSNWENGQPSHEVTNTVGTMAGINSGFVIGKWNDVPRDTAAIGPIHQLWALVEWGQPGDTVIDTNPPPTTALLNLKRWRVQDGGNDHWYGIHATTMPWVDHRDAAGTFSIDSITGHLAVVSSDSENIFIRESVIKNVVTDNVANEFYLGAVYDSGSWQWINGELFDYANWNNGEPSFEVNDPALAVWGSFAPGSLGYWNDCPRDTAGHGPVHQLWSVIEFPTPSCQGLVGNIDGDMNHSCDIGDLSCLVTWLFIHPDLPISLAEADMDGDDSIDIGDLTMLVDHLFVSFSPLRRCSQ